jgi:hypothetical protein
MEDAAALSHMCRLASTPRRKTDYWRAVSDRLKALSQFNTIVSGRGATLASIGVAASTRRPSLVSVKSASTPLGSVSELERPRIEALKQQRVRTKEQQPSGRRRRATDGRA